MPSNDAHFSGEGHLIEAEISGDVNNTIRPVVCDAAGRLLVDLSGTVVDIGIVQIEDSTGNPIVSTGGALNENLTAVGGAPITEGQKTMANSIPVVIASDQTPIPVTGSFTGTSAVNLIQIDGTAASVNNGTTDAGTLRVTLSSDSTGQVKLAAGSHVITDTGSTTAVTGNVTVVQPTGTNLHVVNDASSAVIGHVITDTGSTTAVTGNVTVVQPTGTNLHVVNDASSAVIGHVISDTGSTTAVTGTVAVTESGTWTVQPGNTANTTPWLVTQAPATS